MKYLVAVIVMFFTISLCSQSNLNDYKYVVVPKTYDFLKEQNQFQINSLSKFLFEKYGFTTIMEGENYPQDLAQDRCLGLYANVLKDSGLFKTKLTVELKNCFDKVVFVSKEGTSKDKSYQRAYSIALREAFESFDIVNYNYKENKEAMSIKNESKVIESKSIKKPSIKEENTVESTSNTAINENSNTLFKRGDSSYLLTTTNNGFILINKEDQSTVARLITSTSKGVYHYLGLNNYKGLATFTLKGNLVVEYLDVDNTIVKLTYTLQ